jgi:hypothetical protein
MILTLCVVVPKGRPTSPKKFLFTFLHFCKHSYNIGKIYTHRELLRDKGVSQLLLLAFLLQEYGAEVVKNE